MHEGEGAYGWKDYGKSSVGRRDKLPYLLVEMRGQQLGGGWGGIKDQMGLRREIVQRIVVVRGSARVR